ncbi:hypothetical protein DFJ74DRAFT_642706 [Hyaloraphidium curvatum]|nr:hypothetical protein DFJ74DRAFT_642706 [Hyaloraphidium curvatum]
MYRVPCLLLALPVCLKPWWERTVDGKREQAEDAVHRAILMGELKSEVGFWQGMPGAVIEVEPESWEQVVRESEQVVENGADDLQPPQLPLRAPYAVAEMTELIEKPVTMPCPPEPELGLRERRVGEPGPAVPSLSSLPPELLLLVMELVLEEDECFSKKKSLLDLLSTCRRLLTVGIPLLVRKLKISPGYDETLDKWRGLLTDALDLKKLQNVSELDISIGSEDPFPEALLRGAGPYIRKLGIYVSSLEGLSAFLRSINHATSLIRVEISLGPYGDHHLCRGEGQNPADPRADAYIPLLEHLDELDTLDHIQLHSYSEPTDWVPSSLSWPEAISSFPNVAAKLRKIMINANELPPWTMAVFENVDQVDVSFFSYDIEADENEIASIRASFPSVEDLWVYNAPTRILAGCEWEGLKRIHFHYRYLDLSRDAFPAVRAAIASSGTRIDIDPNWEGIFAPRATYPRSMVRAMEREERFWSGIERYHVERYDGYPAADSEDEDEDGTDPAQEDP